MAESAQTLATLDLLYDAALDASLWPAALQQFARAVGGMGTALIPITPNSTTGLVVSPVLAESKPEYERGWYRYDSRVARIHARGLSQGVCCEAELFTPEEVARDPLRQEFCRSYGMGDFAAQLVAPLPDLVVAFSVMRALDRGRFEKRELVTLGLIGKHAARALVLSSRLAAVQRTEHALAGALARLDCGALVIDRAGNVLFANEAAARLFGNGLAIERGQLVAAARAHQPALARLMRSAIEIGTDLDALEPIALPRPGGRQPLLVQAIPVGGGDAAPLAMPGAAAVVIVVEPEDERAPSAVEALRLLGLTPAQARLAGLVGTGHSRSEAAAVLGISEWTARDALKKVYSRLNISRQAELVQLVDRLEVLAAHRRAHRDA
jgi:DNA-binding CsgD family transcriptional regulator/PAS domain-containing protein